MKKYDGVLQRVRQIEEKNGIKYHTVDGGLYRLSNVIYTILAAWTILSNLVFIWGNLTAYAGTEAMARVENWVLIVAVCTVLMLAGYIFNCFKKQLTAGILNIISSVLLVVFYGSILRDVLGIMGFKPSFYWRHLIPLSLIICFTSIMAIIALRAAYKTNKLYNKVTEDLYNVYNKKKNELGEISDEQWDEFLKKFNLYKGVNQQINESILGDSADE